MKYYKLGLILILIILFPSNANALMCSNSDKVKFQNMAKNITSTYSYEENNNNVSFNITLSNIPEKFIVSYLAKNQKYNYTSSELTLNGFEAGKSYRFDIYVDDVNCFLDRMYSIYVTLPAYNIYYNDEICKGIESYKYCNKWQSNPFTYEEFVSNVNTYKESLIKEDDIVIDDTKGLFESFLDIYVNYYYIILPIIIVLSIIYIYLYNKKNDLF